MPPQLFLTTGIPVCLWFAKRDKAGKNIRCGGRDRWGETLFIDARQMGTMETRVLRYLTGRDECPLPPDSDIGRIVGTYHAWRGEGEAGVYGDVPGFSRAAQLQDIRNRNHILTPALYVGAALAEEVDVPFEQHFAALRAKLEEQFAESIRIEKQIRENLDKSRQTDDSKRDPGSGK
jgi:type I restriction enzyme M protein